MLDSTPTLAPAVPTSLHELMTSLRTALYADIQRAGQVLLRIGETIDRYKIEALIGRKM